jgi:hypothetical protein
MAGILINNQSIKQSIAHNLSALCLLSVSAIQHWFFYRAILHSPYECRYSNICVTVYDYTTSLKIQKVVITCRNLKDRKYNDQQKKTKGHSLHFYNDSIPILLKASH